LRKSVLDLLLTECTAALGLLVEPLLLAERVAVLRLLGQTFLLASEATGLFASLTLDLLSLRSAQLLTLGTHLRRAEFLPLCAHLRSAELLTFDPLHLRSAKLLTLHALHLGRGETTAAVTVPAATGLRERRTAAAATAAVTATTSARRRKCRCAASAIVRIATATTVAATRASTCWGRYRQRGNARGEEHPAQHEESPFERRKRPVRCTVPSPERMEPAF
jgi:hypothetical protein